MANRISISLRVAAIPVLLALVQILESRHPFTMFRLVTFGIVFFLLANIASLLRGKWCDFFVALSSLAFGIFLIEGVANIWEPMEMATVSPDGFYATRAIIGWGPIHAGQFHAEKTDPKTGATIFSANYTIDSNLLRQTLSCDAGPTIVFFGCSYTFGEGLNDADTMPQAFSDSLDRKERVLNLGFEGYGPQHFLSELQSGIFDTVIGPQPKLFVFLTSAVHAERSACKPFWVSRGPRYALEDGRVILKGTCYEGFRLWLQNWLQFSAAYCWLIEPFRRRATHDDIELYIRVVLAAINLAKEKYGVPVIVLYFKGDGDAYLRETGFSTDSVLERLKEGGATVVDTSLDKETSAGMALRIPGDGHPTALANRLRAAILKNYLERNMPSVLASSLN
jgi:hypothetical protein